MKLVEAEAEGPVEGDAPVVTPPRPRHRAVSVSLLFTLFVLTATVVAIYVVFPARDNVLLGEAIARHREPPTWDLTDPTPAELRAWAIGVAGKDVPLPAGTAVGAKRLDLLDRGAALIRFRFGSDEVTYLVQHPRGIVPDPEDRATSDLHAYAWKHGKYSCIAVGPEATREMWLRAVR
jgi:hypothetical protein